MAMAVYGYEECCKRMKDAILNGKVTMEEQGILSLRGEALNNCPWCGKHISITEVKRRPVTRIGFYDCTGAEDETEFDTVDDGELAELWYEFCRENDIITYIHKKE